MAQIQYIKHLWEEEGKSLREISRITGMTFLIVQKYAYKDNWSLDGEPEKKRCTHHPVLGSYIYIIDEWLLSDLKEPRKQHHTVRRIHSRLQAEHGFQGSYECVKDYVRAKKKQLGTEKAQDFLPLNQPKAHAQIDFGQFKYYGTSGTEHIGHTLIVSFPYSNAAFNQVFQSENQECLLEGLKRIFTYIGGVPIRIKADNMTTAVAHVLKDGGRALSDGFARFMLHYRF